MRHKKIAVIGTGFAGLAAAWHMSSDHEVTIFTSPDTLQQASTVSAGLLHPYGGAKAKDNWRGKDGVQSTLKLLHVASEALGKDVFRSEGILRIASSFEQEASFRDCAARNTDVRWLSAEECQEMAPGAPMQPGIFIESGITVYPDLYIEGLQIALKTKGVVIEQRRIDTAENLDGFDKTVFCVGAGVFQLKALPELKLRPVKGQILQLPWPSYLPPLRYSINSKIYMVMSRDQKSCYVGSTFERDFETESVDLEVACSYILPKLYELYPPLEGVEPINCKAGIRVATRNHLPLVDQISPNVWLFTGLGSKGLLYHSLLSEKLF